MTQRDQSYLKRVIPRSGTFSSDRPAAVTLLAVTHRQELVERLSSAVTNTDAQNLSEAIEAKDM
jgi:hypothetical protein